MQDNANNVIDARLSEALGQYFNGVTLKSTVGDCAILTGVRKQNGAPVSIYTPSFSVARDESVSAEIGKSFAAYDKLASPRLQAIERLLTNRAFRKTPALAVLSCPVPVFDDAFDTLPLEHRLHLFDEVLEGLAALHGAGLVHGNLSPEVVRRESEGGAARLCDLTFSGDRPTTVTSQPPPYQSRHVINTTQPRAEDDVHAAGMLGYRILMGPAGPARVLTGGADDPEAIVAAILGEAQAAPTADELFPEGHASAEQIARLLARMTGRLENASPYSNADAARRAFRTVLSGAGHISAAKMPPVADPSPTPVAPAQVSVTAGISKPLAITMFAGFLTSTAAACYFFIANAELNATLEQAAVMLRAERTKFSETETAWMQLRVADRTLATAEATGAGRASSDAAAATEAARQMLADADTRIGAAPVEAGQVAETARENAEAALSFRAAALQAADTTQGRAEAALTTANLAVADTSELLDASETANAARQHYADGAFEIATATWAEAEKAFAEITDRHREAAQASRARVEEADIKGPTPQAILAQTYVTRASAAFDTGQFSEAAAFYDAALSAFTTEKAERITPEAKTRSVTIGDDPAGMKAAISLCLEAAPIAKENCPVSRPATEAAREATLRPYAIDETEVSVADFRRFVEDTGYITVAEETGRVVALTSSGEARLIDGAYSWSSPGGPSTSASDMPDGPVTNIALRDATAYCDWAGGRLPTEAEWEATAGASGALMFPWGTWSADAPVWRGAPKPARRLPTPVDQAGGASAEGHHGMSGNAREWVLGADGAVLKGGSWNTANPADLRVAARLVVPGNAPGVDFGLRCARDLEAWP